MAKKSPILYSVSKTFVWFAIVSVVLAGSLAAIVWLDHDREWKVWQKKFTALKLEKTKAEIKESGQKIDQTKLAALNEQLKKAREDFEKHNKEYAILRKEMESLSAQEVKTRSSYQDLKQYQDSYKYYLEEARLHGEGKKASDIEAKLAHLEPKISRAKLELETLEAQKEGKEAKINEFLAKEKELEKELNKIQEEKNRLEKRAENLRPSFVKEALNAPMLDFLAPTMQVRQVVLDELVDDYHFVKVQKVDRCVTCHLGIDQKGFENAPQPFKTHPRPELYLSSASPHPVEKFGCTVCHGGNGHSVSFVDSAHTPKNEEQKKAWEKEYRWHELEKWESKMLPATHGQAACAKCHQGTLEVPGADKLNQGRRLAATLGCANCHKISGFENAWKVGPSLEQAQSKLDEKWIARWLNDPKQFRPSTKMPQIFHLSNATSAEDRKKDDAAIVAITSYLTKHSDSVELTKPPAGGDAARGEKLVKTVGCLGCHQLDGVGEKHFGSELSGLGSKVKEDWLYSWLKEPKHVSPKTRMPNLRLSDEEAADITAFLLSRRNEAFERSPLPKAKQEVVDEMVLASLQGTMRRTEADAALGKMTPAEKMQFLGKKSITHQGCFACHAIRGFEDAKPIGADLSTEGRKGIHQFDFGFIPTERTREAWVAQKLEDPRIFDRGKVKEYYEKLRMPQFELDKEEREALTTFVLSLTDEYIPLEMQKRPDLKEKEIEKGRRLVSKLNCAGCHTLDGKTGTLREITEDPGAAPPVLDGEGAKVHEKWLHEFLQHPVTIRPWLIARMPTFGLSDEEASTLVQYFTFLAHQDISYQGAGVPETTPEKLEAGKVLFGKLQCVKCHQVGADSAAMGASFLAPDLTLSKERLKPDWTPVWLRDPQSVQSGTMMPAFFPDGQSPVPDIFGGDAERQIEAIRDYLYRYEKNDSHQTKE